MNYREFRKDLKNFSFFTLNDVKKLSSKVYHHRLIEWQKLGYIDRIGNGVYKFSEVEIDETRLYYIANIMYVPSYVSLETALSFYGLIPESVYSITSVCGKKTQTFKTNFASFEYKKIKSSLFFGYSLLEKNNFVIKIAEPEKAVLDYFYLNTRLSTEENIIELRINQQEFRDMVKISKLLTYLKLYSNKRLNARIKLLLKYFDVVQGDQ